MTNLDELERTRRLETVKLCEERIQAWDRMSARERVEKRCAEIDAHYARYPTSPDRTAEQHAADLRELLAESDRLRALVDEARGVVGPFAAEGDRLDPVPSDGVKYIADNVEVWQCGPPAFSRSRLTYGNLRAARTLLNKMGEA